MPEQNPVQQPNPNANTNVRLTNKLEGHMAQAQNFLKYGKEDKAVSFQALVAKRDALVALEEKFENIFLELLEGADDGERPSILVKNEQFATVAWEARDLIEARIEKVKPTTGKNDGNVTSTGSSSGGGSHRSEPKLPVIKLPEFDGTYSKWTEFIDYFKCMIDRRTDLEPVQKFTYLKGALKGEPAQVINGLSLTNQNYAIALDILKKRYANNKLIIEAHLDKLLNLPRVTTRCSSGIRKLVTAVQENLQALENLQVPVDSWDILVKYLIKTRLEEDTCRTDVEKFLLSRQKTSVAELLQFLLDLAAILEKHGSANPKSSSSASNFKNLSSGKPKPGVTGDKDNPKKFSGHVGRQGENSGHVSRQGEKPQQCLCYHCQGAHAIQGCTKFLALSPEERKARIMEIKLCLNCLSVKHFISRCPMDNHCSCRGRHNELLHMNMNTGNKEEASGSEASGATSGDSKKADKPPARVYNILRARNETLLTTSVVLIRSRQGSWIPARALIDQCSDVTLITKSLVAKCGLRSRKCEEILVEGIGGVKKLNKDVDISLTCVDGGNGGALVNGDSYIIDRISGFVPKSPVKISDNIFRDICKLPLADPQFNEPNEIDLLLGSAVYPDIIREGVVHFKDNVCNLVTQNTVFGWVVSGNSKGEGSKRASSFHISLHVSTENSTDELLKKFWEVEEIPHGNCWSLEEKACEDHFVSTTYRDDDGRYVVSIPWRPGCPTLGESRSIALKRLLQVEKRVRGSNYGQVIQEYIDLDHAEVVPGGELDKLNCYLNHFGVSKECSTSTKLRAVFNGSGKTSSGVSLNDCIMVGPKVQQDLFTILVRWRQHAVAFSADIAKMYRQIRLNPSDRDFHRFLWRNDSGEIVDYRMTVVTFGISSSAHQAQRSVKQLALDEAENFPIGSKVLERDLYMDDALSGAEDIGKAQVLMSELKGICRSAGFELRKWVSSEKSLLESTPLEEREVLDSLDMDLGSSMVKTLGVFWNPELDVFVFKVAVYEVPEFNCITRRHLLSEIAKVFDPLGLLQPAVMEAKILLQSTWVLGVSWDSALPKSVVDKWISWRKGLEVLNACSVPRCIVPEGEEILDLQVHGFGDASEVGYSAVLYLRTVTSQGIYVSLITCKGKVAPVRKRSLPRLELCAALLVANLVDHVVQKALTFKEVRVFGWSDSTVSLDWICSFPGRWKTFVANRVSEIQDLIVPSKWRFVSGSENPSDCGSRGLSPELLSEHSLYWNAPEWLSLPEEDWPSFGRSYDKVETMKEARKGEVSVNFASVVADLFNDFSFSSLTKLIRVVAWCLRWLDVARGVVRSTRFLDSFELDRAMKKLIMSAQGVEFSQELEQLRKKGVVRSSSRLQPLCPFVGPDGLIRVGGRLSQAKDLSYDAKHPILLPKGHVLSRLVVEYLHKVNLHAGPQLLVATLRQKYWIVGARDFVRQVIFKCVVCRRYKAKCLEQVMGSLPLDRISVTLRAFYKVGVDFAGPFLIKFLSGRRINTTKGYVSLFVCMNTKAVHLEAVTDLTSEKFLDCFRRFVSRRGKPSDVYSDNGGNFVGTFNELEKLVNSKVFQDQVGSSAAELGISWHFSPPKASHWGGLWERGVRSMKFHLKRSIGEAVLTYEELSTVLCQIEACLNSRPLCPMSSDPSDLQVLTPGHFIIGQPLNALPELDVTDVPLNRLKRFQFVNSLHQQFWKRWSLEYVSNLQDRVKWRDICRNVKVGDLVLLKDENSSPGKWLMGRVINVFPGSDQNVRVVEVKTVTGIFKRSVSKLVMLLEND